jgi:hypothetical protein
MAQCKICKCELDNMPEDLTSLDCGGDCLLCMAECGDEDCLASCLAINASCLPADRAQRVLGLSCDHNHLRTHTG